METQNVFALFDTYDEANDAIIALGGVGFTRDDISLLGQERSLRPAEGEESSETAAGAAGGATVGGIAGLVAGLSGFTVPPVGAVLGTGLLGTLIGTTAAGAGIGLVAGGLLGALGDLGAPEERIRVYEEGIRRGHILVAVSTPASRVREVKDTLRNYGGQEIYSYEAEESRVRVR